MANNAQPDRFAAVQPPKKMAHFVLRTGNFKPMVSYYKTFLGAKASYENEALAFLTYDEEHHRIAIGNVPGLSPAVKTAAGLEHVAFAYDTLEELVQSYRQRKAHGILPIWCVNHGPTTSMYYQDPDGNQSEVQVDNFDTVEEATAFMMSDEFGENPVGVDFDPEDLAKRLEGGEDIRLIKTRPNIGPRSIDTIPQPPKPDVRDNYEKVTDGVKPN